MKNGDREMSGLRPAMQDNIAGRGLPAITPLGRKQQCKLRGGGDNAEDSIGQATEALIGADEC